MSSFVLDKKEITFKPGQTIMQAAEQAGVYIPHLCYHPEFHPHGSCRVCIVEVNGRHVSACTEPAREGIEVLNVSDDVQRHRRQLLEMLFVEGNHVCPGCEKSGRCTLQSVAEFCGMLAPSFAFAYPRRQVDASHPDYILDFNRCILCELCVRASRDVDRKSVFQISGRGGKAHLSINSSNGLLSGSDFSPDDRAASVCPVGVILPKHQGFDKPIGERRYDRVMIDQEVSHER